VRGLSSPNDPCNNAGKVNTCPLPEEKGEAKINPQRAEKAAPLGNGQTDIKVPGPPVWGFYARLVTQLRKTVDLLSSKEFRSQNGP
jgi:hypothetical protein